MADSEELERAKQQAAHTEVGEDFIHGQEQGAERHDRQTDLKEQLAETQRELAEETQYFFQTTADLRGLLKQVSSGSASEGVETHAQFPSTAKELKGAYEAEKQKAEAAAGLYKEMITTAEQQLQTIRESRTALNPKVLQTRVIDTAGLISNIYRERQVIDAEVARSKKIATVYQQSVVKESGYSEREELYTAALNNSTEQGNLRNGFIGMGALFNRKAIRAKVREGDELWKAYSESGHVAGLDGPYLGSDDYRKESLVPGLVAAVADTLRARYEGIIPKESWETGERSEAEPVLSEQDLGRLNDEFLDLFFRKQIKAAYDSEVENWGENSDRALELANQQVIEKAVLALKRSYRLPMNKFIWDNPALETEIQQTRQELQALPYIIKDVADRTQCYGRNEIPANELFQEIARVVRDAEKFYRNDAVRSHAASVLLDLQNVMAEVNRTFKSAYARDWEIEHLIKKIQQPGEMSKLAESIDVNRWEAFKQGQIPKKLFGEEHIRLAEHCLGHGALVGLYRLRPYSDEAEKLQKQLEHFVTAETAPFIIMGSYRNWQGAQFAQERLWKDIQRWPPEVLASVEKGQVPGLAEAVQLMKDHPDNYYAYSVKNEALADFEQRLKHDDEFIDELRATVQSPVAAFVVEDQDTVEKAEFFGGHLHYDEKTQVVHLTLERLKTLLPESAQLQVGAELKPSDPLYIKLCRTLARETLNDIKIRELRTAEQIKYYSQSHSMECVVPENRWQYYAEKFGINMGDLENEHVPNPVYREIREHLGRAGDFYLNGLDGDQQYFAMGLLVSLDTSLPASCYSKFDELLRDGNEYAVDVVVNRLERYRDQSAAQVLINNYDSFAKATKEKLNGYACKFLDHGEQAGPEFELLCKITQRPSVDVRKLILFDAEIKAVQHTSSVSDFEGLQKCLDLCQDERVPQLVRDLKPFGFYFKSEQAVAIPDLLARKDEIIKGMQEIRKTYPGFSYSIFVHDGKYNIDPYDQLVTSYLGGVVSDTYKNLASLPQIDDQNWARYLIAQVAFANDINTNQMPAGFGEHLQAVFGAEGQQAKNLCLGELRKSYQALLADRGERRPPLDTLVFLALLRSQGDIGHLTQIEMLGKLTAELRERLAGPLVAAELKGQICQGLLDQEQRFTKQRWSEEEKMVFYGLSHGILKGSPVLYGEFLNVAGQLNAQEMEIFVRDFLPLFQARLILAEVKGADNQVRADAEYRRLQKDLSLLGEKLSGVSPGANKQDLLFSARQETLDYIQNTFKDRFGLLKTPENWDQEKIRFVQNFVRYLGNLNDRNADREKLVAFYLGLNINGEWEKFRKNETVDAAQYFSGPTLEFLNRYLEARRTANVVTPENIGLTQEQLTEFQGILQEETLEQLIGNIETIDTKLQSLVLNIEQLGDPDIYNEQERQLLGICRQYGKQVGSALAKSFQALVGKRMELSPAEKEIMNRLGAACNVAEWNQGAVKEMQDRVKPMSLVANVLKNMEGSGATAAVEELRSRLQPPADVVGVFERLGEQFRPGSGVLALSQDLSYLENLIVKDHDKLTESEDKLLREYLDGIREQMQKLEALYQEYIGHVEKVGQSLHAVNQPELQNRISEIQKVIHTKTADAAIMSHMTNNFNLIIENMRQCLGCLNMGANNDTNLTFADSNKFYMMSQVSGGKGSVADEIAFLCPSRRQGQEQPQLNFVLDQVYGSKSSDILLAHVKAATKKYNQLKQHFPNARLGVMISHSAMASVGLNETTFLQKLEQAGISYKTTDIPEAGVELDFQASAGGDHYIEMGEGGARTAGKRVVKGIVLQ